MMFFAYSCCTHCADSNEPKNIESGVCMQKLLQFSCCCFCLSGGERNFRFKFEQEFPVDISMLRAKVLSRILASRKTGRKFRFSLEISGPKFPVVNGSISWGPIKGPLLPQRPKLLPSTFSPLPLTIVDLGKLAPSHSLPWFLHIFEGLVEEI